MATGRAPLTDVDDPQREWIRRQSERYNIDVLGTVPPIPPRNPRRSGNQMDERSEPRINNQPADQAPTPSRPSSNAIPTTPLQRHTTPIPPTALRQLPRWFHAWLSEPSTSPHVRAALERAAHPAISAHAIRYSTLSQQIRDTREHIINITNEYQRLQYYVSALLWDRSATATNLLELHAEFRLFPFVHPPDVFANPGPPDDGPDDDGHPGSSPDGSTGSAFPGGARSGFPPDPNVRGYDGDDSHDPPASGMRRSTHASAPDDAIQSTPLPSNNSSSTLATDGDTLPQPQSSHTAPSRSYQPRQHARHAIRCWRCHNKGHTKRECSHQRLHRKHRGTMDDETAEAIADLLSQVRVFRL